MNQRHINNNYQKNVRITQKSPNYISTTIEYGPAIIRPTKNFYIKTKRIITTTNSGANAYITSRKKYYNVELNTPNNISYNDTQNNYNVHYSKPTYIYPPKTNSNLSYELETPKKTNETTYTVKTYRNYEFHEIKDDHTQIKKRQSAEILNTDDYEIYSNYERRTNFHENNPLNLNYIYNTNDMDNYNIYAKTKEITYENKNTNNIINLKRNAKTEVQNNVDQNTVQNKANSNNYYKNNQQTITNKTKNSTSTNNIFHKNNKSIDISIDYNKYLSKPNTKSDNNKTVNSINNIGINSSSEPPDNKRRKKIFSSKSESYYSTLPITKRNDKNNTQFKIVKEVNKEKKSNPNLAISNLEISFNQSSRKKRYDNTIPEKINDILLAGFDKNYKKNIKNVEPKNNNNYNFNNKRIRNSQKTGNLEYVEFGNYYVLINGKYVDKKLMTNRNNKTNINQNQKIQYNNNNNNNKDNNNNLNNDNKNIKTNAKIEKNTKKEKTSINNKNKDNDYSDKKNNQNNNSINSGAIFDTYSGEVIKNQNEQPQTTTNTQHRHNKDQKKYYNKSLNNYNSDFERNNQFKEDKLNYTDIYLNNNKNINNNMDINQQNKVYDTINNQYKNVDKNLNETEILTLEQQNPKKRRPVYKIPPSKKRSISHGRSLAFIHKYYDENFILEEDNEDNPSDNEKKKKLNKKLKTIFREVTNISRLIPQWQKMKDENVNHSNNDNKDNNSIEQNENLNINIEETKNVENKFEEDKKNNIESPKNTKTSQNNNCMRMSRIRFSFLNDEKDNINNQDNQLQNKKNDKNNNFNQNTDINADNNNKQNLNINNNINLDNETQDIIDSENDNTYTELNSQMKKYSVDFSISSNSQSKEISEKLEKEKNSGSLSGSNLYESKNSQISIEQKNSLDNLNINLETKTNPILGQNKIESNINEENNSDIDMNLNINIENKKKENENNDDKRISLDIAGHNLDKYFEKEGVNKRDPKQEEVSTSLKTIDLNEENKNSHLIVDEEEDEEKDYLKNFQNENMDSIATTDSNKIQGNKDGDNLLMLNDGSKGSSQLSENI